MFKCLVKEPRVGEGVFGKIHQFAPNHLNPECTLADKCTEDKNGQIKWIFHQKVGRVEGPKNCPELQLKIQTKM